MEKKEHRPLLSKLIIIILIVMLIVIYARYVGIGGIQIKEYNLSSSNIPESFDGFSIVQFSDLLYGSTIGKEELNLLVEKINELKPNIIVFTGDIYSEAVKPGKKSVEEITKAFKKMDAEIGKYSVRGDRDVNNDYYKTIIDESNFLDLSNNYELIYYKGLTPIVIYGLDTSIKGNQDIDSTFIYPNDETDSEYMATYRILLAHEPDTADSIKRYNISLMLAGHSLNSSINIPYIKELYKIKGASKYYDDSYNINGMKLYISSGLGTNKYKMRLFSKPSISIFRLFHE